MYHSYDILFLGGIQGFAAYLDSLRIPNSILFAYMAKTAEFFGGLMVLLNIFTRIFSALLITVMLVAVFVAHKGLIFSDAALAFNYLLMAIILFFDPNIPFKLY